MRAAIGGDLRAGQALAGQSFHQLGKRPPLQQKRAQAAAGHLQILRRLPRVQQRVDLARQVHIPRQKVQTAFWPFFSLFVDPLAKCRQ